MDLPAQIIESLAAQNIPTPSSTWLASLINNRNPPPPLVSLVATARTRLLASDLTSPGLLEPSYATAHCLPRTSAATKDARLGRDVVLQVLDIENLSRSKWDQVEELEAIERGEQTRGREIVRIRDVEEDEAENQEGHVDESDSNASPTQASSASAAAERAAQQRAREAATRDAKATHKLVLQDCKGQKIFALELKRMERIGVAKTNIGEKVLLKANTSLARGTVLLEPANCLVLGGKVEAWHKAWLEGRLAQLRESVGADRDGRNP